MSDYSNDLAHSLIIGMQGVAGPGTASSFALSAELTNDGGSPASFTAGTAVAVRFMAPAACHVHNFYVFLTAAEAGSAHNLTAYLCNRNASYAARAGTILDSVSASGGTTANKWIKFTFTGDVALTAGEAYWLVVGDATGAGGAYQVLQRPGVSAMTLYGRYGSYAFYTTSDGFATNASSPSTSYGQTAAIVTFSNGYSVGSCYTSYENLSAYTLERGMKCTFTEDIKIIGVEMPNTLTNVTTFQIHQGDDQPVAGTESLFAGFNGGAVYTMSDAEKLYGVVLFGSPITLEKDTVYRFTVCYTGAGDDLPEFIICDDVATPGTDAVALSLAQGNVCATVDSGAGAGWTDFNNATDGIKLCTFGLIVYDQVAIEAGGGGGGVRNPFGGPI